MTEKELVEQVHKAFGGVRRPDCFVNAQHCEECAEHNETLSQYTPENIPLEKLGNPGWDPICFVLPEAFIYYFRGLIRLAMDRESNYAPQFLFHATYEGIESRFFKHFNREQRIVTLAVIQHLHMYRSEQFVLPTDTKAMETAISLWNALANEA